MGSKEKGAKAKILAIPTLVKRTIERDDTQFDQDDIDALQVAISEMNHQVHQGLKPFRVDLRRMTEALNEASKSDIESLEPAEVNAFTEAFDWFSELTKKYGSS